MRLILTGLVAVSLWAAPNFSQTLTIDHTKCGSADSTNFPVLVKLSGNNYKTRANGGLVENASGFDIQFWNDAALTSSLFWEMDFYDGTNGVIWAWVRIPTVSHTADTLFYISFGDPSITTFQSTATTVWSNGYDYVWHGGNGTVLGLTDSTTNANTATNSATPVTATTGQIAGGGAFVSASSEGLTVDTDPAALQPSTVTASAWVNYTASTGVRTVFAKQSGYRTFSNSAATMDMRVIDSGGNTIAFTTGALNDGNWHYVAFTFDATSSVTSALKPYVDGSPGTPVNAVATGNIKYTAGGSFTGENTGIAFWQGSLDEIHVATGARPASWILTEFNNQNAPNTFITASALNTADPAAGTRSLLGVGR